MRYLGTENEQAGGGRGRAVMGGGAMANLLFDALFAPLALRDAPVLLLPDGGEVKIGRAHV